MRAGRSRSLAVTATFLGVLVLGGCSADGSGGPAATVGAPTPAAAPSSPATGAPGEQPAVTSAPEFVPGEPTASASPSIARSASAAPPIAEPGAKVVLSGENWPPSQPVTGTVCGNNFLNGSVDCNVSASGQSIAKDDGTFILQLTVGLPPTPCPCVIHVVSAGDTGTADVPFVIPSAEQAPPTKILSSRAANVVASLRGSGPWQALFGGAAQREFVVSVTNTGTTVLQDPQINLTYGKGDDPTTPLLGADGQPIKFGLIQPTSTVEVRVPVTFPAPTFGKYRVKGVVVGLDSLSVDGEALPQGDNEFAATTSTYPWMLIAVAWLLLQIPLLGLYKRRPSLPDDAIAAGVPPARPDLPASIDAWFPLSSADALPPPPPGFVVSGATLVGPSAAPVAGVDQLRQLLP